MNVMRCRQPRRNRLLAGVAAVMVLHGCGDIGVTEESLTADPAERIAMVRQWYSEALALLQEERLGKFSNEEILNAMVERYPPDWSQAVSLPISGIWGATRITTILGPEESSTTHSHEEMDVVRTISVDVNQNDEVIGSRLLEFASPDSLDRDDFASYVKQWDERDFGDLWMLTSEYDIAYDAKLCEAYTPGEGFEPLETSLEEVSGLGKTEATYYCYVVKEVDSWVCVEDPVTGDEACDFKGTDVYMTCVEVDEDYGGGDGDGSGGGGGGGGSDSTSHQVEFEMNCDRKVTRGDEGGCEVTVSSKDDGITADQFTFTWSSDLGASYSGEGKNTWEGIATKKVKVQVSVSGQPGFTKSKSIRVKRRKDWRTPALSAEVQYTGQPRAEGMAAFYKIPLVDPPAPEEGTGPWAGNFMAGLPPTIPAELHIAIDYDTTRGPTYTGANNTCTAPADSIPPSASYYVVNKNCGSLAGMMEFHDNLLKHEREHEAGFNDCLSDPTAGKVMKKLEAMVGSKDDVKKRMKKAWTDFYTAKLFPSGTKASQIVGTKPFWSYVSKWIDGISTVVGHPNGISGC